MSIGQKFEKVADAVYEKGYTKGGLDASPQETVSGEIVAITDISPIEHNVAVKASSKNLLPYPYESKTQTKNGIEFTINEDGTINVNGTATANTTFVLKQNISLSKDATYTLSGCPSGGSASTYSLYIQDMKYNPGAADSGKGGITFTAKYEKYYVWIQINSGATLNNLVFKPQIELGTTAKAYTPYVPDVSVANVEVYEKNLLPYPYRDTTKTTAGITFTDNGDGSITANGTATGMADFNIFALSSKLGDWKAGSYVVSGCPSGGASSTYRIMICNLLETGVISYNNDVGNGFKLNVGEGGAIALIIRIMAGTTVNNLTFYPMIEAGDVATPCEPYVKPASYKPMADGTVEGVTSIYPNMTITTDTDGVIIEANYYQDGKKVKENLIDMILSLGGVINE